MELWQAHPQLLAGHPRFRVHMNAIVQEIKAPRTTVYLPYEFDWKAPDYKRVFQHRAERLAWLRERPARLHALKSWYKKNTAIAQFLADWGCMYEPRNIERGLPVLIPFIPFPKQVEWIDWLLEGWRLSESGLTEKSRECGVSWLFMCTASTLCTFYRHMFIGVGSAKADKVDRSDDPDTLFAKARAFMNYLPMEFRGGWREDKNYAFMRMGWPETDSSLTGEAGDNIGRGGRKAIYGVDEAAHLERPQLVEKSLLSNTNCRIDISSVAGMANPFAQKRHQGKVRVFTFSWRHDPRKDQAWFDKVKAQTDNVTMKQEVEMDYLASSVGQVIEGDWLHAAVGALEKLGIKPSGMRRGALDVADEGSALNAAAVRYGQLLEHVEQWSGKGSDIYDTVQRMFDLCEQRGVDSFLYDADGVGSGVRGDARVINERRKALGVSWISDGPFHGGGKVDDPDGSSYIEDDKYTNKDFFKNLKAQSWWMLRIRFRNTYRAIQGESYDPDAIISIPADMECLPLLMMELVQPRYKKDTSGKLVIDKMPEGAASPNLADAVMMAFSPVLSIMDVWGKL